MIAPAYEPACGGSASVHNYGVMHPDPVLLSDMTSAERGAVYRYLARFAELDDAKIFYAYGHAYELARKDAEHFCFSGWLSRWLSGRFQFGWRLGGPMPL